MARRPNAAQALDAAAQSAQTEIPNIEESEAHIEVSLQEVKTPAEKDQPAAEESGDGDEAIEVLRASYEEMRKEAEGRKQEAENLRVEMEHARQAASTYRSRLQETTEEARRNSASAIQSAIAHTTNNITTLKGEISRAGREQDWDALSEAQEALAQNSVYLAKLKTDETAIKSRPQETIDPDRSGPEAIISKLSPSSQAWVRKHQGDIFSSTTRQQKAQACHFMVVADGIDVDTPAYFEALDKYMGYKQVVNDEQRKEPAENSQSQPQQRQPGGVPSAPPARHLPGQQRSNRGDTIKLNPDQIETAIMLFSDKKREDAIAAYARGLKDIQEGKTNLQLSDAKYRGGKNG